MSSTYHGTHSSPDDPHVEDLQVDCYFDGYRCYSVEYHRMPLAPEVRKVADWQILSRQMVMHILELLIDFFSTWQTK